MTRLRIPVFLHEAFGETQSAAEIALVLVFGGLGTIAMILLEPRPFDTTPWRATLAALLTFDVFAGALANLTRGTNDHYAARAGARWLFIAVHLHLIAFAWLIGEEMASAVLAWLYTVGAAATVNLLAGHSIQRIVGGALFCLGALGLLLLAPSMQPALQVMSLIFMFKVIYAFGVDHRAENR